MQSPELLLLENIAKLSTRTKDIQKLFGDFGEGGYSSFHVCRIVGHIFQTCGIIVPSFEAK